MDDFSQMLELVAQQLKGSDSALRVERAYPAKLRGNPQCEKLAVIGIQKVKLEPVGLQNFYGGQTLPLGRQATVWVKVSFCCKKRRGLLEAVGELRAGNAVFPAAQAQPDRVRRSGVEQGLGRRGAAGAAVLELCGPAAAMNSSRVPVWRKSR